MSVAVPGSILLRRHADNQWYGKCRDTGRAGTHIQRIQQMGGQIRECGGGYTVIAGMARAAVMGSAIEYRCSAINKTHTQCYNVASDATDASTTTMNGDGCTLLRRDRFLKGSQGWSNSEHDVPNCSRARCHLVRLRR